MCKLTEKEAKALIKANLSKCNSVFNGKRVKIHKGFQLTDGLYDLIVFKNGTTTVKKTVGHSTYIEFGEYLISVPSPSVVQKDVLDFSSCTIYNIYNGNIESKSCKEIGQQKKCNIIIVDSRILVICREKNVPDFYIMVHGYFEKVEPFMAEHLLNIADFTKEQVTSLLKFYPNENWTEHNGLVVNLSHGRVPSQIQLELWKKIRHVHANIKKGIQPETLIRVFTPGSRPLIRHISMANI